jgi:hypothetical protein
MFIARFFPKVSSVDCVPHLCGSIKNLTITQINMWTRRSNIYRFFSIQFVHQIHKERGLPYLIYITCAELDVLHNQPRNF